MRLTAVLCLTTALLSAPALAQEAAPARDSTPFTLSSGTPRTPDQLALRFFVHVDASRGTLSS